VGASTSSLCESLASRPCAQISASPSMDPAQIGVRVLAYAIRGREASSRAISPKVGERNNIQVWSLRRCWPDVLGGCSQSQPKDSEACSCTGHMGACASAAMPHIWYEQPPYVLSGGSGTACPASKKDLRRAVAAAASSPCKWLVSTLTTSSFWCSCASISGV